MPPREQAWTFSVYKLAHASFAACMLLSVNSMLLQIAAFQPGVRLLRGLNELVKGTFGIVTSKEECLGNSRNDLLMIDSLCCCFWNVCVHFINDISCQLVPISKLSEFWSENDWNRTQVDFFLLPLPLNQTDDSGKPARTQCTQHVGEIQVSATAETVCVFLLRTVGFAQDVNWNTFIIYNRHHMTLGLHEKCSLKKMQLASV